MAQEKILGHRKFRDQVQFLIDDGDAGVEGRGGIAEIDGASRDADRAGGRRVRAGEGFEQRGFAGAVFAQQRVDGTFADAEGNRIERAHARIILGNVLKFQVVLHGRSYLAGESPCDSSTFCRLSRVVKTPSVRVSTGGIVPSLIQ